MKAAITSGGDSNTGTDNNRGRNRDNSTDKDRHNSRRGVADGIPYGRLSLEKK